MDQRARARQIQQMVNFMKLEARDKATEIRHKTEHDCTLERQKLVVAAKKKLAAEFEKRGKRLEVEQRVAQSHNVMKLRMQKLVGRDELLQRVLASAKEEVQLVSSGKGYRSLLAGLIVQGVHTLKATEVTVIGREQDRAVVVQAAQEAMGRLDGVQLRVSDRDVLPAASSGGVILTSHEGKIKCDNTLDSRLTLAFHDLAPALRHILFPSCRAVDRKAPAAAPPTSTADVDLLGLT